MSRAWVVAGGGASGSVSAGAMEILSEKLPPTYIAANSAGSLNALGYSVLGPTGLVALWRTIKSMEDIFKSRGPKFWPLAWNMSSFYTSEPLIKLLTKHTLGQEIMVSFSVNVVDLEHGMVVRPEFKQGNKVTPETIKWVVASASIPVLTEPVMGRYVDGGVVENVPLSQAIRLGYKDIVLFLNDPVNIDAKLQPKKGFKGMREVGARALELLMMESYINDIKLLRERNLDDTYSHIDLEVVAPKSHVLGVLDFNPKMIYAGLIAGREIGKELLFRR